MKVNDELEKKLKKAKEGRMQWIRLMEQYGGEKDKYIILFPHKHAACNNYVLKYLSQFVEKVHVDTLLMVSCDKVLLKKVKDYTDINCIGVFWDDMQIQNLLSYYSLHMFTNKLIIVSLDEPQGRNGTNLIGTKGVTEEEIVAIGILGLKYLA